MKKLFIMLAVSGLMSQLCAQPPAGKKWKLVFEDNFDYPNEELDKEWISQNGPNGHILSSRWRENVTVENGELKLLARKEARGGQEWTAGSIWTKKLFKYGYYECRYKYAAATGTNNSFWLMTQGWQKLPEGVKRFEIDINEGHYPDEINTNIHNWSDFWTSPGGKRLHHSWHKAYTLTPRKDPGRPDRTISLDVPVLTDKIRLSTKQAGHIHISEIRIFPKNYDGYYPELFSDKIPEEFANLENYARTAKITGHSELNKEFPERKLTNVNDGKVSTSWLTNANTPLKYIELDLGEKKSVGAVQFATGWLNRGEFLNYIHDYKVEYWDGSKWVVMSEQEDTHRPETYLNEEYHVYALEWNEQELVFYFDGREIRRWKNDLCHWESPVWLSLAIANFAGAVTDEVDGTSMDVDYVRVWQEEGKENWRDRTPDEPQK